MLAISRAIVDTLADLNEIDRDCKPTGGARGSGWLRYHLKHASEEETAKFTKSLEEVLGPLENPRYIISRPAMYMRDTWLMKYFQRFAKFLRRAERSIQMYHTVPSIVANTKDRAEIFKKNWDYYIGKVKSYCRNDEGRQYVDELEEKWIRAKTAFTEKKRSTCD